MDNFEKNSSDQKLILLVDDDRLSLLILGTLLKKAGFSVLEAQDGLQALKILETQDVHALITDFQMPRINGRQLAMAARSNEKYQNIPIFIVSDYINSCSYSSVSNTYYLSKPANKDYLITRLNKHFSQLQELQELNIEPTLLSTLIESTQKTMSCLGLESLNCEESQFKYADFSSNNFISSTTNFIISPAISHQLVLSFSKSSYQSMLSTMAGETKHLGVDEDIEAISDVFHMILDNTKAIYKRKKLSFSSSTVVVGENHRLYSPEKKNGILHRYQSGNIEFLTLLM